MHERLGQIQIALREAELDGWLLADYRGRNPSAVSILGAGAERCQRRVLYWLPADGLPVLVVHHVDQHAVPAVPGDRVRYTDHASFREAVARLVSPEATIAVEHSPMGTVSALACVDAGLIELLRSYGASIVASDALVQRFLCRFDAARRQSHLRVGRALGEVKDALLEWLSNERRPREQTTQARARDLLDRAGLVPTSPPLIAFGAHTANPAHFVDAAHDRELRERDLVRVELCALEAEAAAPAAIAWMCYAARDSHPAIARELEVLLRARDIAVELMKARALGGQRVLGFEVDRAVRQHVAGAGLGARFVHRTGHCLSAPTDAEGATLDDYEAHDARPLEPGMAWLIAPGVYAEEHGLRVGTSVLWDDDGPVVSTPQQDRLSLIEPKHLE